MKRTDLYLRRLDAALDLIRKGERTAHEVADAICMHPEHVRVYYLNLLIAEGKIHIARAGRGPKHTASNAFPIYAFGPPAEGIPHCHRQQLALCRATVRAYRETSLTPIIEALRYADMDLDEIIAAVGVLFETTKRRVDYLIERGDIHVSCRENRPGHYRSRYVYSIGPGRRMPATAEKQYAKANREYKALKDEDAERRKEALRQPARVDIAAAWFMPQPTKRQEIRA